MWSLLHTETPVLVAFLGVWVLFREYRKIVDIVGIVVDIVDVFVFHL